MAISGYVRTLRFEPTVIVFVTDEEDAAAASPEVVDGDAMVWTKEGTGTPVALLLKVGTCRRTASCLARARTRSVVHSSGAVGHRQLFVLHCQNAQDVASRVHIVVLAGPQATTLAHLIFSTVT